MMRFRPALILLLVVAAAAEGGSSGYTTQQARTAPPGPSGSASAVEGTSQAFARADHSHPGPFINVKAPPYGALCDGNHDDSGAFAAAAAAATTVFVPAGTCSLGITGFTFPPGVSLIGAGEQATTLTYSGTGCAIIRDGVQGTTLARMKVVTTGNGAGVRAFCEAATGGITNIFNNIEDVYFVQNNATHRVAGQIALYLNVSGATGIYWNKYKKVECNFWDTCVQLSGNGTNQPNENEFDVVSAASNVPFFVQRANDNGIKIRCTTSDGTLVAGTQVCLTVGDGTNLSAGNVATVFSDQGATGKGVALAANSSKNYIVSDNESGIPDTDLGTNNNLIDIGSISSTASIYRWRIDSMQITGRGQIAGITSLGSGIILARTAIADTDTTATTGQYGLYYTTLTATRKVTLPSAGTATQFHYEICDETHGASGTVKIQVLAPAGQTVNGTANPTPVDCVAVADGCCHVRSAGGTAWFKW